MTLGLGMDALAKADHQAVSYEYATLNFPEDRNVAGNFNLIWPSQFSA